MGQFVLRGCPYPVAPTPHGYFFSQSGVNQIKSDILQLLLTNPKERVMTPEFGTDLRQLMFEPADSTLIGTAQALIANAISKWEPRIAVQSIKASVVPEQNTLNITITFLDPTNIQDIEVLTVELPLAGGNNQ